MVTLYESEIAEEFRKEEVAKILEAVKKRRARGREWRETLKMFTTNESMKRIIVYDEKSNAIWGQESKIIEQY